MDLEQRRTVIAALIELAGSDDYRDRAAAGRALASFADAPESREQLLRLLLDAADTFVTRATAEALLRRHDAAGLALVADALASADFPHRDHIHDALVAVLGIFAADRDKAIDVCNALALDISPRVRHGAVLLREMLGKIHPVLYPEQRIHDR